MSEVPELQTPRLVLRGHVLADFAPQAAMWADPAVMHYIGTGSTRQESWFRLLRCRALWDVLGYGYWAVHERESGRYVGDVGFADWQRETEPSFGGVPEAGWVLAGWTHGRGYASEATAAAFDWMDRAGGHARTVCILDARNAASLRVAQKNGFVSAGTVLFEGMETPFMERFRPGGAPV